MIAEVFRDGKTRVELLTLAEQYERLADTIAHIKRTASEAP